MNTASRTPLGNRLRELRQWSGMSIADVAAAVKCSVDWYNNIELGKVRASRSMRRRLADVLDCDVNELSELAAWHDAPAQCASKCLHHGFMVPGGVPSAVRESCAFYADCLGTLVLDYPTAKSGHCSPACTAFTEVPRHIRLQLEGGQNGDRRYDYSEAPGDMSMPKPKRRLPLVRHSGTQTAQLCTCTSCESIRRESA